MASVLFDENIQGHLRYFLDVLDGVGLRQYLLDLGIDFYDFPACELPSGLKDRDLWLYCQDAELVLLTDDRNRDNAGSLQATLEELVTSTCLPVLTISNKGEFEHSRAYAERVAKSVAEVLYGLTVNGEWRGVARQFVPLAMYP